MVLMHWELSILQAPKQNTILKDLLSWNSFILKSSVHDFVTLEAILTITECNDRALHLTNSCKFSNTADINMTTKITESRGI